MSDGIGHFFRSVKCLERIFDRQARYSNRLCYQLCDYSREAAAAWFHA